MIHTNLDKFSILQKQIEEVGVEEAHKFWQVRRNPNEGWIDCTEHNLLFQPDAYYRLKPKTRTIKSSLEYPEPIWEKPKEDITVYYVDFLSYCGVNSKTLGLWCYSMGTVQATEEGAKQMLAALQNALSGGKHD
jgi:hypothetical protein